MPTVFTHPAVPLGLAPWVRRIPKGLIVVAALCSSAPDVDVGTFAFDIPYGSPLGHRGVTHSLLFAAALAAAAVWCYRRLVDRELSFSHAFLFVFASVASHGILDAMTTGGKGVGFFIPFSMRRFFLPFRPIRVSPIDASSFMEKAGTVLVSEATWVWLPLTAVGLAGWIVRRRQRSGGPIVRT